MNIFILWFHCTQNSNSNVNLHFLSVCAVESLYKKNRQKVLRHHDLMEKGMKKAH